MFVVVGGMAEHPGVRIEEITEEDVESVPVSRTASVPIVQEPDDEEEGQKEKEESSGSESDDDEEEEEEGYYDDSDDDDGFFGFGADMMSMLDGFGLFGRRRSVPEKKRRRSGSVCECRVSSVRRRGDTARKSACTSTVQQDRAALRRRGRSRRHAIAVDEEPLAPDDVVVIDDSNSPAPVGDADAPVPEAAAVGETPAETASNRKQ